MKINEKIHVSLAIDSHNNTSFDINPDENIEIKCQNLMEKYNFSQTIEKNLKKFIDNFISEEIKKEKEKKEKLREKANLCVIRLYNNSIKAQKEKKDLLHKYKEEKYNEFVNKFPFKPKIKINKTNERYYQKIEEKLIEDGKKSKEKQALKRIEKEFDHRKIMRSHQLSIKEENILKTENSSPIHEERKINLTAESLNNNGTISINNIPLITSSTFQNIPSFSTYQNISNSNYQTPLARNIIPQSNLTNIINNKYLNNSNNETPQTEKKYINTNKISNPISNNIPTVYPIINHRPSFLSVSSNLSNNKNNLYLPTKNLGDTLQSNKSHFNNNLPGSIIHTSSSHVKYADQYLKNKNIIENSVHFKQPSPNASLRKIDINNSTRLSQEHYNLNETKSNKDLIVITHTDSNSNQATQPCINLNKFGGSLSFRKETNGSKIIKEKSKLLRIDKLYHKKGIKKNKIKKKKEIKRDVISFKYRFKDSNKKENDLTIYESCKLREKTKKHHYDHIKSSEFSFKPTLTEGSKRIISKSLNKFEDKESFYNRLTNSKRIHNLNLSIEKLNKSSTNYISSNTHSQKNNLKRSSSFKSFTTITKNKITGDDQTEIKSLNNILTSGNFEKDESGRIREFKKHKELIEKNNNQKFKEKKMFENCAHKIIDNINKFKLNNLKEIFEIIYNNCSNIDDIQNIENYGINLKIKDKLILPTVYTMKERNLEFNFQNFFLTSNEVINLTIDAQFDENQDI